MARRPVPHLTGSGTSSCVGGPAATHNTTTRRSMSDLTRPARPISRNININQIVAYRLPAAGVVSILHRISGFLLFLLLPFVLYLFDRSLTSVGTFNAFKAFTSHWYVKVVILVLIWSYLQHFVAGIRHLFMDVHLG